MPYSFAQRVEIRGRKNVVVNVDGGSGHLIATIKRKARA
jgi:hypothetical protein